MTTIYEHLVSRSCDPKRYHVHLDEVGRTATFILSTLAKTALVGFQQYRPDVEAKKVNDPRDSRYFTYAPRGTAVIFGVEAIDADATTPLFIVEGVFKATKLHSLGFDTLAVLTSSPALHRPLFEIVRAKRRVIAIGDADDGGRLLVNTVGSGRCAPADLDEMDDASVLSFVTALTEN